MRVRAKAREEQGREDDGERQVPAQQIFAIPNVKSASAGHMSQRLRTSRLRAVTLVLLSFLSCERSPSWASSTDRLSREGFYCCIFQLPQPSPVHIAFKLHLRSLTPHPLPHRLSDPNDGPCRAGRAPAWHYNDGCSLSCVFVVFRGSAPALVAPLLAPTLSRVLRAPLPPLQRCKGGAQTLGN